MRINGAPEGKTIVCRGGKASRSRQQECARCHGVMVGFLRRCSGHKGGCLWRWSIESNIGYWKKDSAGVGRGGTKQGLGGNWAASWERGDACRTEREEGKLASKGGGLRVWTASQQVH